MTEPRPGAGLADAAAFLTRLAPARPVGPRSLARALPWFWLVGLGLGLLWTAAALAMAWLPAARGPASAGTDATVLRGLAAAWLWLLCAIVCTRGLHWDGVADLGDASGSAASGEAFRRILADSRLGAFGALRLLLVFSGQWLALSWHFTAIVVAAAAPDRHDALLPLAIVLLAPAWGRSCAVLLARPGRAAAPDSLGGLFCAGATPGLRAGYAAGVLSAVALLLLLGLPFWQGLALLALQMLLLYGLDRLAARGGGLSGDFFGAAIEEGQLCFLLATL